MEGVGGGLTEVKAEVPMAEMLTYAPDLRSLTGGQGEYTMEFGALRGGPGAPPAEGRRAGHGGGASARSGESRPRVPLQGVNDRRRRSTMSSMPVVNA